MDCERDENSICVNDILVGCELILSDFDGHEFYKTMDILGW